MRSVVTVFLVTAITVLFSASSVLALGGDHPQGKITELRPEWPKGLMELVNSDGRVQGSWVNQNDFFFFKGDAAAFGKFVERYAKVLDTPLKVVIHAGSIPLTGPLGKPAETSFDWQLRVIRRGWGAPLDPRRPNSDPGYVVTLHLWVSDNITLDQLEIPKQVDVISAGDIEKFIDSHKNNR